MITHNFKVGDKVIIYRRPDIAGWPGGADEIKENFLINKTALTVGELASRTDEYGERIYTDQNYTIPVNCIRLFNKKPLIVIRK